MNLWLLFEIAVNIFQGGVFAFFGSSVFPAKVENCSNGTYILLIWFSCSFLLTFFTFFPLPYLFLDLVIIVSLFIVITLCTREGSTFYRVFWSVVYFAMYGCLIYLIMTIALSMPDVTPEFLFSSTYGRILYVLTANGVLVSMTFLIIHLIRKTSSSMDIRVNAVSTALIIANLLVLLIILELTAALPQGVISPVFLIVSAMALLAVNTLAIWMFQYINKQNEVALEAAASTQRTELQAKHQEEIGHIESELRNFRHDSHSHFQYLLMMAETGELDAVKSYLRKLTEELDALSLSVNTGNTIMDAILNVKAHIAEHDDIQFEIDAVLPPILPITENDIVIIVGNILDNAIEASRAIENKEERVVRIFMKIKQNLLVINAENRMVELPKQKGMFSLTTKHNGSAHGLGLKIIREGVAKYGGSMDIKQQGNMHEISVIIPINEKT